MLLLRNILSGSDDIQKAPRCRELKKNNRYFDCSAVKPGFEVCEVLGC